MLEWLMLIGACVLMYRMAEMEDMSGIMWGAITFAVGFGLIALLPGLPFLRVLAAPVIMFIAMMIYKVKANK